MSAFAALAAATAAAQMPAIDHLAIERIADRVVIRVDGRGVPRPRISEPLHTADRTRLRLTVHDAVLEADALTADHVRATGLIAVGAWQRDTDVTLDVDAAAIGRYGIESNDDGFAVWIETLSTGAPGRGNDAIVAAAAPIVRFRMPQKPADVGSPAPSPDRGDRIVAWLRTLPALARPAGTAMKSFAADAVRGSRLFLVTPGFTRGAIIAGLGLFTFAMLGWIVSHVRALAGRANHPVTPAQVSPRNATVNVSVRTGMPPSRPEAQQPSRNRWWPLSRRKPAPETIPGSLPPNVAGRAARLWAARTLATEGLDASAIAERTGLARDAAAMVVSTMRPAKAAGPGTNFRPHGTGAALGA